MNVVPVLLVGVRIFARNRRKVVTPTSQFPRYGTGDCGLTKDSGDSHPDFKTTLLPRLGFTAASRGTPELVARTCRRTVLSANTRRTNRPVGLEQPARLISRTRPGMGRRTDPEQGSWGETVEISNEWGGDPLLIYRNSESRYTATGRVGPMAHRTRPRRILGRRPSLGITVVEDYDDSIDNGTRDSQPAARLRRVILATGFWRVVTIAQRNESGGSSICELPAGLSYLCGEARHGHKIGDLIA